MRYLNSPLDTHIMAAICHNGHMTFIVIIWCMLVMTVGIWHTSNTSIWVSKELAGPQHSCLLLQNSETLSVCNPLHNYLASVESSFTLLISWKTHRQTNRQADRQTDEQTYRQTCSGRHMSYVIMGIRNILPYYHYMLYVRYDRWNITYT